MFFVFLVFLMCVNVLTVCMPVLHFRHVYRGQRETSDLLGLELLRVENYHVGIGTSGRALTEPSLQPLVAILIYLAFLEMGSHVA